MKKKKSVKKIAISAMVTIFLFLIFGICFDNNNSKNVFAETDSNNSKLTKVSTNNIIEEIANPIYRDSFSDIQKGTGSLDVPYIASSGLAGFSFNYSSDDHHIKTVKAIANNDKLEYSYRDKNADDKYIWTISRVQIPAKDNKSYVTSGSCKRSGLYKLGDFGEYIPVLKGFSFNFTNEDHHLRDIGIRIIKISGIWYVEVNYSDKNGDDTFQWSVTYALIHNSNLISDIPYEYTGSAKSSTQVNLASNMNNPVLNGFRFYYSKSNMDRHIDRIGVNLYPNLLKVRFHDESPSDNYIWSVWYNGLK
jgi:hypothetical protein